MVWRRDTSALRDIQGVPPALFAALRDIQGAPLAFFLEQCSVGRPGDERMDAFLFHLLVILSMFLLNSSIPQVLNCGGVSLIFCAMTSPSSLV